VAANAMGLFYWGHVSPLTSPPDTVIAGGDDLREDTGALAEARHL
jgi:hypothetical protein